MKGFWILILFPIAIEAAVPKAKIDLFGVNFTFSANDEKTLAEIKKRLESSQASYQGSFDPDCYYQKQGNSACGKNVDKATLGEIEEVSKQVKSETKNGFDVEVRKQGKIYRDFGGIAQGFVLEKLKKEIKGGWTANFAGDIFVSKEGKLISPLLISDPLVDPNPFALVDMNEGWMLSSSAATQGGSPRDPLTGETPKNFDFRRIVLFAHPEFNGARLDGWATGLIVKGQSLLKDLWNRAEYKGKWAYLYWDEKHEPHCSDNIQCNFKDPKARVVQVRWNEKKSK